MCLLLEIVVIIITKCGIFLFGNILFNFLSKKHGLLHFGLLLKDSSSNLMIFSRENRPILSRENEPLKSLYLTRIFPAALQLACDIATVPESVRRGGTLADWKVVVSNPALAAT